MENTVLFSGTPKLFEVNMYPNVNETYNKVCAIKWCGDLKMK